MQFWINIGDYEIQYENRQNELGEDRKFFEEKLIYERELEGITDFKKIRQKIEQDKVRIVYLIGKNGRINRNEYRRVAENKN